MSLRFRIASFDTESAVLAAKLFEEFKPKRQLGKPGSRDVLKADTMIIDSAKTAGARIFYSDDQKLLALARRVMTAHPLPEQPPHLFGYERPPAG